MYRFLEKLKLSLRPPKSRDRFSGDAFPQLIGRHSIRFIHGMKEGHEPIYGPDTYQMTMLSDSMPSYYRFSVRVKTQFPGGTIGWSSSERRISKDTFHKMLLDKLITKEQK